MKFEIKDLGLINYKEALDFQRKIQGLLIENKRLIGENRDGYLIFAEHRPVITLGRHGKITNILNQGLLKENGIETYQIERGGDVTYHNPGQMVVYPIFDLQAGKIGVKKYVSILEESIIKLLNLYGIDADRKEGAPGVWIEKKNSKICALGISCTRFVTMHGLALNVNNDLSGFGYINPCGFVGGNVTSMKEETGQEIDMEKLKKQFSDIFLGLILSF